MQLGIRLSVFMLQWRWRVSSIVITLSDSGLASFFGVTVTHRLGVAPCGKACLRGAVARVTWKYTIWSGSSTLDDRSRSRESRSSGARGISMRSIDAEV